MAGAGDGRPGRADARKRAADEWHDLPPTLPRVAVPRPSPQPAPSSPSSIWDTLRRHLAFELVFLLAMGLLAININAPWHSAYESNGLVFESIAVNHIRFGLIFTKGQDYMDRTVENPAASRATGIHPQGISNAQAFQYFLTGPTHPVLYGHHPPLLGLTVAVSLLTFGYQYWAVRLVPILFTLLGLTLFYLLMTLLFDRRTAVFASLLFATFPITAYFGRDVAHEAPTMACELGMALCYVLWRRSGRGGWLAGLAGCIAVGLAYGWPMLFFAWILLALHTLVVRRVDWRFALATGGVATLMFALVIAQIVWADNGSFATLHSAFFSRATTSGKSSQGSPIVNWLVQVLRFNLTDFGSWTWYALPPAVVFLWKRFQREGLSLRIQLIALFGLGGLAHILVFRDGSYYHMYWQFYLIPFYALVLGWAGVALAQWLAMRPLKGATSEPRQRQAVFLLTFTLLALVMAIPVLFALHTGWRVIEFPAPLPMIKPLLDIPTRLVALITGHLTSRSL